MTMRLSDFLTGVGRPVAYYPGLRKITGSTNATIFICQLVYWTGKESSGDGWIYKTSDEIEEETGLSYKEQTTAREKLIAAGLLEERYARLEHRIHFKVNLDALNSLWDSTTPTGGSPTDQGDVPETPVGKMGKRPLVNSLISNTENTTENTADSAPASSKDDVTQDVMKVYQNNIGMLTPIIADAIQDAEKTYGPVWVCDAITEAVKNEARSWKYCEAILSRWARDGRGDKRKKDQEDKPLPVYTEPNEAQYVAR